MQVGRWFGFVFVFGGSVGPEKGDRKSWNQGAGGLILEAVED